MLQLHVSGIDLQYEDTGTGAAIVFVHGAWMDQRFWAPQRAAFAGAHRVVTYACRYHGTAPWPDGGRHYTFDTHAADLAALIGALEAGPVHLVGLSMGGLIAALVVLQRAELVRTLVLAEPALPALLAELPEGKQALEARRTAFQPIAAATRGGDLARAAALFFEYVNHQGPGAFAAARALPPHGAGQRADHPAAARRHGIRPAAGAHSGRTGRHQSAHAARRGREHPAVLHAHQRRRRRRHPPLRARRDTRASHLMSSQNPQAFNAAVRDFLAGASPGG